VCSLTHRDPKEVAALATMISASIDYLVMLEDFCPEYNGIALNKSDGWEQICSGIDMILDNWFKHNNLKNEKDRFDVSHTRVRVIVSERID